MRLFTKFIFFLFLFTLHHSLFTNPAFANNVRVENVSLYKSSGQPAGTMDIKFDVIWDNPVSGTDANSQAYFDRAWIFVKFWDNAWATDGTVGWGHAKVIPGGSLTAYSSSTNTGTTSEGIGAFVSPGVNQIIRWNYGSNTYYSITGNNLADTATVKVRVMAIEMVRVPQGSFYVGDGTSSTIQGQFESQTSGTPFQITGEGQLTLGGGGAGSLGNNNASGMSTADDFNDSTSQTLPAAFPKGYNAFYIMKYEVSQNSYRDFLNMLSRPAQNTRTASVAANQYVMSNTATVTYRSGIRAPASIPSGAITFGCDLNGNGTFNESDDGEWGACNYLSWVDLCAFADWAGLRPMTELEYEKACRGGGVAAVANEYAWHDTTIDYFSDLSNDGTASESKGPTRTNANCNYSSCTPDGPIRCGMFSTNSSTRTQAGGGYYGAMELSGNLYERPVSVGNSTGRGFTGTHGNGALTSDGYADNSDWPGYVTSKITGATGSGFRGGSWGSDPAYCRVSGRYLAAYVGTDRSSDFGVRAARTSP